MNRERLQVRKAEHISGTIEKVLGKIKSIRAEIGEIQGVWSGAVGEEIAAHTFPVKIDKGCLLVRVDSAVWLHQLSFLKEKMVKTINKAVGHSAVKEIRFRIEEGRG